MPSTNDNTNLHSTNTLCDLEARNVVRHFKYNLDISYTEIAGRLEVHPSRISRVAAEEATLTATQKQSLYAWATERGLDMAALSDRCNGTVLDELGRIQVATGRAFEIVLSGGTIASTEPYRENVQVEVRRWGAETAQELRAPLRRARPQVLHTWPSAGDGALCDESSFR